MDTIKMVATTFTNEQIEQGKALLVELDSENVSVPVALWYCDPEVGWKLLLSLPEVVKNGPQTTYEIILTALKAIGESPLLQFEDIMILRPDAPLIGILGVMARTGSGITGVYLSGNTVNGQLIPDAYIYRLA